MSPRQARLLTKVPESFSEVRSFLAVPSGRPATGGEDSADARLATIDTRATAAGSHAGTTGRDDCTARVCDTNGCPRCAARHGSFRCHSWPHRPMPRPRRPNRRRHPARQRPSRRLPSPAHRRRHPHLRPRFHPCRSRRIGSRRPSRADQAPGFLMTTVDSACETCGSMASGFRRSAHHRQSIAAALATQERRGLVEP